MFERFGARCDLLMRFAGLNAAHRGLVELEISFGAKKGQNEGMVIIVVVMPRRLHHIWNISLAVAAAHQRTLKSNCVSMLVVGAPTPDRIPIVSCSLLQPRSVYPL